MYIHVCKSLALQPMIFYNIDYLFIFQHTKNVLTQHERKLDRVSSHRVSTGGRHFPKFAKNNTCGDKNSSFA